MFVFLLFMVQAMKFILSMLYPTIYSESSLPSFRKNVMEPDAFRIFFIHEARFHNFPSLNELDQAIGVIMSLDGKIYHTVNACPDGQILDYVPKSYQPYHVVGYCRETKTVFSYSSIWPCRVHGSWSEDQK